MVRVVAAGHVNWDVTLEVDRLPVADDEAQIFKQRRGGGGSAANVAAALRALDVGAGLIGSVGDDAPGRSVRSGLRDRGVDCTGVSVHPGPTTVKYLLVGAGGDVAVLGNAGVNEAFTFDDVDPGYLAAADHLHLTNQHPETAHRLAELAREAGLTVSFDPGRRAGDRDFRDVLEYADLVFASEREAAVLVDGGAPALAGPDRHVAVTRGAGGAVLHAAGTVEHRGFQVESVDTSGAGDAFAAGYLSVWLDDPEDVEAALAVGNACGALTSRHRGARADLDRAAVESLLAQRP